MLAVVLAAAMAVMTAYTRYRYDGIVIRKRIDSVGTTAAAVSTDSATVSDLVVTADMANFKDSDEYTDWTSSSYTTITGNGDSVTESGTGATYSGTDITITEPGTYVFTGRHNGRFHYRGCNEKSDVRIVLNGFTITNSDGPAINCVKADKVVISLAEGTENEVTDGSSYADTDLSARFTARRIWCSTERER